MAHALDGIRIVEVGEGKQLAYCGKLLRDLGAELIKVEPPHGDQLRLHGPFPNDEPGAEQSGLFIYFNGGKRGARLDLARAEDRAALQRLLDDADVLLMGMRPSQARAAGLDPDVLLAERPGLVVGTATIYGFTGPRRMARLPDPRLRRLQRRAPRRRRGARAAQRPARRRRHPPRRGPARGRAADGAAAQGEDRRGAARRRRQPRGLDLAIWGHGIPQIVYLGYLTPQRNGARISGGVWGPWPTKDGHFAIMTQVPRHWQDFLVGLGDPEWAHQPLVWNLGSPGFRRDITPEQGVELDALLQARSRRCSSSGRTPILWELCRHKRISCQPVLTIPRGLRGRSPQRARLADRRAGAASPAARARPPVPPLGDALAGAGTAAAPRRRPGEHMGGASAPSPPRCACGRTP